MFYIDLETQTTDKYDMAKFISFDSECLFNCLDSYFLQQIPVLPISGYYTVRKEVAKPDLLSYNIYGDTQYWWILLWYNEMIKPQDLKAGVKIKYPSLSSIEQLYMNASLGEKVN